MFYINWLLRNPLLVTAKTGLQILKIIHELDLEGERDFMF
jgi:hypothetical protein